MPTAGAIPGIEKWGYASDLAVVLRIHPRTVQRWIHRGWLRARRFGNVRSRWRLRMMDFETAWIASARRDPRVFRSTCPFLRR